MLKKVVGGQKMKKTVVSLTMDNITDDMLKKVDHSNDKESVKSMDGQLKKAMSFDDMIIGLKNKSIKFGSLNFINSIPEQSEMSESEKSTLQEQQK
jgi:hypothetical protein